ncbi:hypothetical protein V9L20_12550 [Variovorax sp. CCNWLW225]|uniref:hypothetical protein n=1 Tax=Variovorax sp. CCNWLW225 TaxID=3127462 RepID=UPI003076E25B
MAKLDPTVFNRLRLTIDDFTDAAHRLVQQLDGEIDSVVGPAKNELQRYRDLVADLGRQLDSSDPDGGEVAGEWGASKGE